VVAGRGDEGPAVCASAAVAMNVQIPADSIARNSLRITTFFTFPPVLAAIKFALALIFLDANRSGTQCSFNRGLTRVPRIGSCHNAKTWFHLIVLPAQAVTKVACSVA
jgi:hypothetical protein